MRILVFRIMKPAMSTPPSWRHLSDIRINEPWSFSTIKELKIQRGYRLKCKQPGVSRQRTHGLLDNTAEGMMDFNDRDQKKQLGLTGFHRQGREAHSRSREQHEWGL